MLGGESCTPEEILQFVRENADQPDGFWQEAQQKQAGNSTGSVPRYFNITYYQRDAAITLLYKIQVVYVDSRCCGWPQSQSCVY